MAWRSQEMHFNFKGEEKGIKGSGRRKMRYGPDDIGPQGMPDEFFDENGEINLSQVQGESARRYFEMKLGIPLPPGVSKFQSDDPTSRQIREAYNVRPQGMFGQGR